MNVSQETEDRDDFRIDFIDPLFAVAVHLGLAEAIIVKKWFHAGEFPKGEDAFTLGVFSMGLLTLVLSWVGYHESIKDKPLKGLVRFAIDVVLVILYALILVQADNFNLVLMLLTLAYGFFFLWDWAKLGEYPDRYNKGLWPWRYHRELVTIVFFGLFISLSVLNLITSLSNPVIFWIIVALTFAYRLCKSAWPWRWRQIEWKKLLLGLEQRM